MSRWEKNKIKNEKISKNEKFFKLLEIKVEIKEEFYKNLER